MTDLHDIQESSLKDIEPPFPRIIASPKSGKEPLYSSLQEIGVTLQDFWRWSLSDVLSNATRGILAEFIVAQAMGIPCEDVRDEWGAFDLLSPEPECIRIEVKSAAYIQCWNQKKLSTISFRTPKTLAWNPDSNAQEKEARRQAEVYVFALLAPMEQTNIDPLNIDQWNFYVLSTMVLDARTRSQHSIALKTLETLSGGQIAFSGLKTAVEDAAAENRLAVIP